MTDLHVDVLGDGAPVVFVHGSFGTALGTFSEQRPLARRFRLMLVDRRGFGRSPGGEELGWATDMRDVAQILAEVGGAHLVGHSYGGIACLLGAGLQPERTRSIVAIEPPAFELARGDADAERVGAAWKAASDRAAGLSAQQYVREWGRAVGYSSFDIATWTADFVDSDWAAAESSRKERWPGDAPIDTEALARAGFPKVLARGAWRPEVAGGREAVGAGFAAVCEAIAGRIGGRVVVFEHSAHNPQREEAESFNALLRETWDAASLGDS